MKFTATLNRAALKERFACPRDDRHWNDSASRSLLHSACVTQNRNTRHGTRIIALAYRHSVADYSSGLVARWASRIILRVAAPLRQKMPLRALEYRQRKI